MASRYPKRWTQSHGAFYYVVPPGMEDRFEGKKWFRLGATLSEAYAKWAELIYDGDQKLHKMSLVIDRYMAEISTTKGIATQRNEQIYAIKLRLAFGHMTPAKITPQHIYQYMDVRRETPVAANREVALLSNMFTKAIRWGAVKENPCIGKKVERNREKSRERYVTDTEFQIFYEKYAGPFLQPYLNLKYLIGARKSDLLRIQLSDISEDGIRVRSGKTGKKILYTWTDDLRDAVDQAKSIKRKVGSIYLFSTRDGKCYWNEENRTTSGFDSIWQRRINKWEKDGYPRFTEHDFRAKTASDTDERHAQDLMQHSDLALTKKVYRRKESVVSPINKRAKKQ